MQNLTTALDAAYTHFQSPPPAAIDGCRHCLDDDEIARLLTTDLRQISPNDLGAYASSVFLTLGSAKDFRYFLPRIFDIAIHNSAWSPSPEQILDRLARAEWLTWPHADQHIVRNLVMVWLESVAARGADSLYEVDSLICGIGLSGDAPEPYLEVLLKYPALLAAFHALNFDTMKASNTLSNPFWRDDTSDASSRIIAFLRSEPAELILAGLGVDF